MSDYRVIEIMNEKEIIINYGSKDDASVGDDVRIYSIGEEVIDPETKEVLGTLDVIKEDLEVVIVYENFSICQKIFRTNFNPLLNPLANRIRTESVELNVDESDISGRKSHGNPPPIKVGDSVAILK